MRSKSASGAIHFTGRRPWKVKAPPVRSEAETGCFGGFERRRFYVGGLLVVVDVVDVPRQAEVCDLHHVVLRHQNVAGGQISVDALKQPERRSLKRGAWTVT